LRGIQTYHIPPGLPAFQKELRSGSLTEAALNMIPSPENEIEGALMEPAAVSAVRQSENG
jgi:hypothetical protein